MRFIPIIVLSLGLFISGCTASEEEVNQKQRMCEHEGIINPFRIDLSFPNVNNITKVQVNRIKKGVIVESFDASLNGYTTWVKKDFYTHDTYEFIIDGEKPFVLSNVKTKLQTHCTWQGCNYPCEIIDATINRKRSRIVSGGIELQKEGYE